MKERGLQIKVKHMKHGLAAIIEKCCEVDDKKKTNNNEGREYHNF